MESEFPGYDTDDDATRRGGGPELRPKLELGGRFTLIRLLGQGGMGAVWLARDRRLGEDVALKMLKPELAGDKRAVNDLLAEVKITRRLRHPSIVGVHDLHEADAIRFISMEYVAGGSLSEALSDHGGPFPFERVVAWARQLGDALDHAHAQHVLHRDIKPGNCLLDADGRAKLADFGIARVVADTTTRVTGEVSSGTLLYMSPEQLMGEKLDNRSDVYSLAASLYELLAGHAPFHTGSIATQIQLKAPPPIEGLPDPVNAALAQGLAKQPQDRPATGAALAQALEQAAQDYEAKGEQPPQPLGTVPSERSETGLSPASPEASPPPSERSETGRSRGPKPQRKGSHTAKALVLAALAVVLVVVSIAEGVMLWHSGYFDAPTPEPTTTKPEPPREPEPEPELTPPRDEVTPSSAASTPPPPPPAQRAALEKALADARSSADMARTVADTAQVHAHAQTQWDAAEALFQAAGGLDDPEAAAAKYSESAQAFQAAVAKAEQAAASLPQGTVEHVRVNPSSGPNEAPELEVVCDATLSNLAGEPGEIAAYFYDANGRPVKARDAKYTSKVTGGAHVFQKVAPKTSAETYKDFRLSLPLAALDLAPGQSYTLETRVKAFNYSGRGEKELAESEPQRFGAAGPAGGLEITVNAPGAAVTLNGTRVGQTDRAGEAVRVERLAPGRYTLAAQADGYEGASETVVIAANGTRYVELALKSKGPKPGDVKTVDLGGGVSMDLVWIPPGSFMMGSNNGDSDEKPVHRVTLTKGFWMGKTEVTNAQYRRYKSSHSSKDYEGHPLNHATQPVVYVSWDDAQGFCRWLSDRAEGTYRLPTEAEWEYACRAGTDTVVYWGDLDADTGRYANVADRTAKSEWSNWTITETTDGYKVSAPVGSFRANGFGLHDTIGNVWEWCADWYGAYPTGSVTDPKGPNSGKYRVVRGGGWLSRPLNCRAASRLNGAAPDNTNDLNGFRVARTP